MNCSARCQVFDPVHKHGSLRSSGGPPRGALDAFFRLMLVVFLSVTTGAAGAQESRRTETAGAGEDAKSRAVADAGHPAPDRALSDPALPNLDLVNLGHINRIIAIVGEHHRDALQTIALYLRHSAAEHGGPILERWIIASRDEALREGTAPIPPEMRAMLIGFFPGALLDRVRYRTGRGSAASLQGHVFSVGDTKGITLGAVIVFRDAETAADPLIWAHELVHVQQYERWGTREFAERYIRSFKEVEEEAWRAHGRYKSWAQRSGLMAQTDPETMWKR